MCCNDSFGNATNSIVNKLSRAFTHGTNCSIDKCSFRNHVACCSGVNLRHGENTWVKNINAAGDKCLQSLNNFARNRDWVQREVRRTSMSAFALDGDVEEVAGGHHGAAFDSQESSWNV